MNLPACQLLLLGLASYALLHSVDGYDYNCSEVKANIGYRYQQLKCTVTSNRTLECSDIFWINNKTKSDLTLHGKVSDVINDGDFGTLKMTCTQTNDKEVQTSLTISTVGKIHLQADLFYVGIKEGQNVLDQHPVRLSNKDGTEYNCTQAFANVGYRYMDLTCMVASQTSLQCKDIFWLNSQTGTELTVTSKTSRIEDDGDYGILEMTCNTVSSVKVETTLTLYDVGHLHFARDTFYVGIKEGQQRSDLCMVELLDKGTSGIRSLVPSTFSLYLTLLFFHKMVVSCFCHYV